MIEGSGVARMEGVLGEIDPAADEMEPVVRPLGVRGERERLSRLEDAVHDGGILPDGDGIVPPVGGSEQGEPVAAGDLGDVKVLVAWFATGARGSDPDLEELCRCSEDGLVSEWRTPLPADMY